MTALCAQLLVDRGQLDLDAPVARYWPGFAQAGKERVTTRHLLTHTAGLAAPPRPPPTQGLYDRARMGQGPAPAPPRGGPGRAHGSPPLTFGDLGGGGGPCRA